MPTNIEVDPLSWCSVRLRLTARGHLVGAATGVTVWLAERAQVYLVSNWHVFSGRDADTGALMNNVGAEPDTVEVEHHSNKLVGRWIRVRYPLRDEAGRQLWMDHPSGARDNGGMLVDVAALPIALPRRTFMRGFPIQTALDSEAHPTVGAPVSVIGFPRGFGTAKAEGSWPIWITGHIATDPDFDFNRRPVLLIDARTREGMSGSPVVIRTKELRTKNPPGRRLMADWPAEKFLGIYAGRIADDLDIGYVWRPHVLREVLEGSIAADTVPGRFNSGLPGDESPVRDIEDPFDESKQEEW
jgi:hypothetical protein